jgi:hypothetical protein
LARNEFSHIQIKQWLRSSSSASQSVMTHSAAQHTQSDRATSQPLSQTNFRQDKGSPVSSLHSTESYFKAPTFPSSNLVEVQSYESSDEEDSTHVRLKRELVSRKKSSIYTIRYWTPTSVVSPTVLTSHGVAILGFDSSHLVVVSLKIVMMTASLNLLLKQLIVLLTYQVLQNLNCHTWPTKIKITRASRVTLLG